MRVLHVLHTSLPFVCGYSIRSDRILSEQRGLGIDVAVVTSAQQPDQSPDSVLAGVSYFRTPLPRLSRPLLRELQLMRALGRRIAWAFDQFRPDVVHAHSPVLVGLPAYLIAKRRAVPLVYEVRDLWENACVDRGRFAARSVPYRAARALETWLLRRADAVFTIGDALRGELSRRTCRHIELAPNGVDPDAFRPQEPESEWLRQWNPDGREVIAYVGSFHPYEGLGDLIVAMRTIASRRGRVRLLIAGDGPERAALEDLVKRENLEAHVRFAGHLPHSRVKEIYSVADLLVYPRISTRTTQLTTPLKPLEALAMQKAVLASNLPAMRELISDGETGMLFEPGNPADLAEKAIGLLEATDLRSGLGSRGRAQVLKERRWQTTVTRYLPVYRELVRAAGASS